MFLNVLNFTLFCCVILLCVMSILHFICQLMDISLFLPFWLLCMIMNTCVQVFVDMVLILLGVYLEENVLDCMVTGTL
jgi:hypothetical protein